MKRTIWVILILLVHVFGRANTIYVDASNTSGTENGSHLYPFTTIGAGLAAANAGDTVMIAQGTYTPDDSWSGNDQTLFLKAGVRLIGENRENTVIDGIIVDQEMSNLAICLENLTFDTFIFGRASHTGPFNDLNVIRNCATTNIRLAFAAGLPVNDTTPGPNYGFLIENNNLGTEGYIEFSQGAGDSELRVTGNSCGSILIKSGAGYTYLIDANTVQYGIWDKSAANTTTISNNVILNGTIDDKSGGNQYGIEDEIIENNIVTAGEDSPAFADEEWKAGISLSSRSATVRNNTITCTGHVSGIRSKAGAPLNILNNAIDLDQAVVPTPDPYDDVIGIFNYSGKGSVKGNNIHGGSYGYYSKAGTVEFSDNTIENAITGFYSMGAEAVHHNTIRNCKSDGMILDGLKGPVFSNTVKDNEGSGIVVRRVPIDLGGGADNCPGFNVITGNGNYDLYVGATNTSVLRLYACHNIWDHQDTLEVMQYDIRDGIDSTGLVIVNFTPMGSLSVDETSPVTDVQIVPNPVENEARATFCMARPAMVRLFIVDMQGRMVQSIENVPCNSGENSVTFRVSGLAPGVFLVLLAVEDRLASAKFVKN